jgi:hypothetical protein
LEALSTYPWDYNSDRIAIFIPFRTPQKHTHYALQSYSSGLSRRIASQRLIRYCNEKSCFHLELDPGAQAMKDPPREERRKVTELITDETP